MVIHRRSLPEWLDFIATLHHQRIDLGLQRINKIATQMELLQFACPVITIAGTNGKGSCIRTLEAIYTQAGYQVAAYTSPHLMRFNERIRIGGSEIADDKIIAAFVAVESARASQPLSFFEFVTLAALYIFKHATLDVILLEIGLGGRLDAVNIVDADIAVITSIALDHCDILGFDRESIGLEKAGIMRWRQPVICADPKPPKSLLQQAKKLQCALFTIGKDFFWHKFEDSWCWYSQTTQLNELPLPALKLENVAASLMVISKLQDKLAIDITTMRQAIATVRLSGRYERIFKLTSCVVLDVAHNPQSAAWLAAQLQQDSIYSAIAVIGMLADKQIAATIHPLLKHINHWYVAEIDSPRGCGSDRIMEELKAFGVKECYNFSSVKAAMQAAMRDHHQEFIVVYGSFYTVAAAKELLSEQEVLV